MSPFCLLNRYFYISFIAKSLFLPFLAKLLPPSILHCYLDCYHHYLTTNFTTTVDDASFPFCWILRLSDSATAPCFLYPPVLISRKCMESPLLVRSLSVHSCYIRCRKACWMLSSVPFFYII
eukprot:Gregarina_sp_Poly_1__8996@NODE_547_length_7572_cov_311_443438_g434_i0_p8_GENE_NODE_547_length_7572_cov_311_443438_g434_i0NODE_547_length_7572_cov_311_443438_g434_i0_p8_ORF_typecomplete_len122_score4_98_NODE_547_length_7572_cov_311_443438_g434_i048105175